LECQEVKVANRRQGNENLNGNWQNYTQEEEEEERKREKKQD
jgi:hypothetical protein